MPLSPYVRKGHETNPPFIAILSSTQAGRVVVVPLDLDLDNYIKNLLLHCALPHLSQPTPSDIQRTTGKAQYTYNLLGY